MVSETPPTAATATSAPKTTAAVTTTLARAIQAGLLSFIMTIVLLR